MQSPKYLTFEFLTLLDKISVAASSNSKSVTAYVPCKLTKFLNSRNEPIFLLLIVLHLINTWLVLYFDFFFSLKFLFEFFLKTIHRFMP